MSLVFRAAVIGAGMIGAKMRMNASGWPASHAYAYKVHSGFELCGIYDVSPVEQFSDYECRIYTNLDKMMDEQRPQVVSVAVPKDYQNEILKYLLGTDVKMVIAEKPLAVDLRQAEEIVRLYKEKNITLLVNNTRRYSKMFVEWSKSFQNNGEEVLSASILYGKGLLHNGSHAIDLAMLLFGKCLSAAPLMKRVDYFENDPSAAAFLTFQYCSQFFLQALDERKFTLFSVDIITDKARYLIDNDHRDLHIWRLEDNAGFPIGKRLVYQGVQQTDYDSCLSALMDNAYAVLCGNANPLCDGGRALESILIIDKIKNGLFCV